MKRIAIFTFLLFFVSSFVFAQVSWYVTGTGNDSNAGKSEKTAFRTLQKAAELVEPGDVVYVGDGVYTSSDTSDNSAVLHIRRSGTADAWITWKALDGQYPVVCPDGWGGITVEASYHILDGINVIGRNDSITLKDAIADLKNKNPNPAFNTNGIFINGRNSKPDAKPHHVIVRNCTVAKCPGGGITAIEVDYITIEDCKVFNNAWFMRYAGSGITTLNNWAFDNAPGYHIIIQRNLVWNNKCFVSWERTGKLSDGNGILLDVTNQDGLNLANPDADDTAGQNQITQATPTVDKKNRRPVWKNRALIANNVSAYNGGSGIHTFRTSHVDIINNTTYWNGTSVGYEEMFPNNSKDIVFLNNIIVPRPGGKVTSNNKNSDIRWDYNIYPVEQNVFKGVHDIVADPRFINPHIDLSIGNFKLKKGSPALHSGTDDVAQPTDHQKNKRPKGVGRDRGAFEQ
jgi:hypothetical protein